MFVNKIKKGQKMSTIAERFKEIRTSKGWRSQAIMADQLDMTRQAIANVEAGNNNPSIDTINKLIVEFNINANWLIAGVGEMFIPQIDDENPQLQKVVESMLKKHGLI